MIVKTSWTFVCSSTPCCCCCCGVAAAHTCPGYTHTPPCTGCSRRRRCSCPSPGAGRSPSPGTAEATPMLYRAGNLVSSLSTTTELYCLWKSFKFLIIYLLHTSIKNEDMMLMGLWAFIAQSKSKDQYTRLG